MRPHRIIRQRAAKSLARDEKVLFIFDILHRYIQYVRQSIIRNVRGVVMFIAFNRRYTIYAAFFMICEQEDAPFLQIQNQY